MRNPRTLNRVIAVILLFASVGSTFSKVFIYAGYNLNQRYIIINLCENKNKPQLHCNGKCYLIKKIKQSEEKQRSEGRQNQRAIDQETIYQGETEIHFPTELLGTIITPYHQMHSAVSVRPIFQPPKANSLTTGILPG